MTGRRAPNERRTRRPQARGVVTRERILTVARDLFSREGYAAVSRADIAREAGYGMSTVYHHFPSKRDILLELIDQWGSTMPIQRQAAFDIKRALDGDVREAATAFLEKSLAQYRTGPSFYAVILMEAERDAEVRRRYERAQRATMSWLAGMVALGQGAGAIRPELDPESTAFVLHHFIESILAALVSRGGSSELREKVIGEMTDLLERYLVPTHGDRSEGTQRR